MRQVYCKQEQCLFQHHKLQQPATAYAEQSSCTLEEALENLSDRLDRLGILGSIA